MIHRIGFMQGRLSPIINGRIQSFPWEYWQKELHIANQIGIQLMEWTLDYDRLYENPLLSQDGQKEILELCKKSNIKIPSVTGDCFMQSPFWKAHGSLREQLDKDFKEILKGCASLGIQIIVMPLVDGGSLENSAQENNLVLFLQSKQELFSESKLKILFESDYEPLQLVRFIDRLDPELFGINYDTGNSAALGFDPKEEIFLYGHRIENVHVKDRLLRGTTVPLGYGAVNFPKVFEALGKINYSGNFILQTARSDNQDHVGCLNSYRTMLEGWLKEYAA